MGLDILSTGVPLRIYHVSTWDIIRWVETYVLLWFSFSRIVFLFSSTRLSLSTRGLYGYNFGTFCPYFLKYGAGNYRLRAYVFQDEA